MAPHDMALVITSSRDTSLCDLTGTSPLAATSNAEAIFFLLRE
jgi:hypothetical protein